MRINWQVVMTVCLAAVSVGRAQDDAVEFPAIKPEVQTAEWAKDWWVPRHESKLAELAELDRVDLLMIGDSITHGWEGGGKAVWDQYYSNRHPFNIGFSGDRTEQVIWRLQNGEIEGISPKLAVVMIGTNNTGHRQDPAEQTASGIEAIVGELHERLPNTKVLLLAIFPRGATVDDPLRLLNEEINQRIAKMADNDRVFYLNINDRFLDEDGSLPKSTMPDLLHPNTEGYQLWAEAMEPTIKKLLDE